MDVRRSRMSTKPIEDRIERIDMGNPLARFQKRRAPGRKMMQSKSMSPRKMLDVKPMELSLQKRQLSDGVPELLNRL